MFKKMVLTLTMTGFIGTGGLLAADSWAAMHHQNLDHEKHGQHATQTVVPGSQMESGGNTTCPVTGEKIDEKGKLTVMHEGEVVNLCCQYCVGEFKKNPGKYHN